MLSAIQSIFRAPFLVRVIRGQHYSFFEELSRYFPVPSKDEPLKNWFIFFYDIFLEKYQCEYVYKNILTTKFFLGDKEHFPEKCWLINEWYVHKSKADIVIMNGKTTAYEIKSKYDSLARLESQIRDYQKVFDHICVVTAKEKVKAVFDSIEETVGVYVLKEDGFDRLREPKPEKTYLDSEAIFRCLRQAEYLSIIKEKFGFTPDTTKGTLFSESKEMFCQLDPKEAHELMRKEIKTRKRPQPYMDLVANAPSCLKHSCFSFSRTQAMAKEIQKQLEEPFRTETRVPHHS